MVNDTMFFPIAAKGLSPIQQLANECAAETR